MQVILEATGGPAAGTKIVVRRGQVVRVGRTKWADCPIEADASMSDVHFAMQYDGPVCRLRDLSDGNTTVNGVQSSQADLHTGDEITAGQTTFSVLVEGEPVSVCAVVDAAMSETTDAAAAPEEAAPKPQTAADYCRHLELSEEAQPLLTDQQAPAEFLDLLTQREFFPDAVRFLAFWLPKPAAVEWGCRAVQGVLGEQLSPQENDALQLAGKWANEPSEENRRAAGAAAEAADFSGPPSWVALGAFWSGGSLAPPDLPEVPPGEGLTAQAITGALMMAAPHGDPSKATDRYRGFLAAGKELAAAREATTR